MRVKLMIKGDPEPGAAPSEEVPSMEAAVEWAGRFPFQAWSQIYRASTAPTSSSRSARWRRQPNRPPLTWVGRCRPRSGSAVAVPFALAAKLPGKREPGLGVSRPHLRSP
jgi:hypothetical protein